MVHFFIENRGEISRKEAQRIRTKQKKLYEKYDGDIPYIKLKTQPRLFAEKDGHIYPVDYCLSIEK